MSRASQTPPVPNDLFMIPGKENNSTGGGGNRGGGSSSWAPPGSPSLVVPEETSPKAPPGSHASVASSKQNDDDSSRHEGIQDKLGQMAAATGSNALLGVMELLKMAGGVTLSTTGKIVAPPLHVTRTILLPSLWAAIKDYIRDKTPTRVKDWFRIVSSSVYHVHSVLISTDRGRYLQGKVGRIGVDIVDCASSEASRQAFMDGMACLVKLSEALHTPETKALLEQFSVFGCRLVDAASTGRAKQLMHDGSDCVWAAIELFADPAATLAFAEVTAYLCHALEMENALHRPLSTASLDADARARLRRNRNRFERQTYVDRHLVRDPDATVEQAILSSIGHSGDGGGGSLRDMVSGGVDTSSLPSNVVWKNERGQVVSAMGSETQSLKENEDDDDAHSLEEHWNRHANEVVDVDLLRENITERAENMELQSRHRTGGVSTTRTGPPLREGHPLMDKQGNDQHHDGSDMEDLAQPILEPDDDDIAVQQTDGNNLPKARITLQQEDSQDDGQLNGDDIRSGSHPFGMNDEYLIPLRDPEEPTPALADDEPAIEQFYRTLDEIMAKKRNETVESLLAGRSDKEGEKDDEDPCRLRYPEPTNEQQEQISAIRTAVRSLRRDGGKDEDIKEKLNTTERPVDRPPTPLEEALDRYTVLLGLFLGCLAVVAIVWFAFGCYGMYMYFFSAGGTSSSPARAASPVTQEIVVRIVKEVVYVNANGDAIENVVPDTAEPQSINAQDIAACVTDGIE